MDKHPIETDLKKAAGAVRNAKRAREYHARKTPKASMQRQVDLENAATRLKAAMRPLRSYMAKSAKKPAEKDFVEVVREYSKQLQTERRKIWKMRQRNEN